METKNSWIPTIKVTTLATWLFIAGLGAWGGVEYTKLAYGIKGAPKAQETVNGYDTKGLADTANAYQYVDMPPKPITEGVY